MAIEKVSRNLIIVQESPTDTTEGIPLTLGAFGLGSTEAPNVPSEGVDESLPSGFYKLGKTTISDLSVNSGSTLYTTQWSGENWSRIVVDGGGSSASSPPRVYVKTRNFGAIKDWQEFILNAQMAGAVMGFAMNTAPTGWLKANGAAINRTTYSQLFNAIGTSFGNGDGSTTFNLPDLRGEFIRGWDDGRGIDSGRSFSSSQLDQMQRITGALNSVRQRGNTDFSGALSIDSSSRDRDSQPGTDEARRDMYFDSANSPNARVSSTTNGETRPRNVALLYCIKY